jgi:hypothetical protein
VTLRQTAPAKQIKSDRGEWGVLAGTIYFIGLLAPLTPSFGHPPLTALMLFAGVPLVLALLAAVDSRSLGLRLVLGAEALAIACSTAYLLASF